MQACLSAALFCIKGFGGLLRQFMQDDKGVVCIWTFGLPKASYEDNAQRGLQSCVRVRDALSVQGLQTTMGITLGQTYCTRLKPAA